MRWPIRTDVIVVRFMRRRTRRVVAIDFEHCALSRRVAQSLESSGLAGRKSDEQIRTCGLGGFRRRFALGSTYATSRAIDHDEDPRMKSQQPTSSPFGKVTWAITGGTMGVALLTPAGAWAKQASVGAKGK